MTTKSFAQESRRILLEGVERKLLYWGFTPEGKVQEQPVTIPGGYQLRGEVFDDPNLPELWEALRNAVQKKGIEVVVEEAAYTWFNRIMAIRILSKNGYDQPQLEYVEGMEHTPLILQRARQGRYDYLPSQERQRLQNIVGDYSKEQEVFASLLIGYCHSHSTLNEVFGRIDDYTVLLLPDDMLQEGGFLDLLNTTDAISDEEYLKVELIGWLYQFYISERKEEVFKSFKKNKKAEAKDIPAATQIFTPNWIVKYMVENTAGKLWLNLYPESGLQAEMKYLVQNEVVEEVKPLISEAADLKLMDPACGSGHILVEGFELLYKMYMEEYYDKEDAVEAILKNNLFGLDLDERAVQLSKFAILLKAAKYYPDVFSKGWMPQVYAMPEPEDFNLEDLKDFLGGEGKAYVDELEKALRHTKQAKNLGSIMKLSLSEEALVFIQHQFNSLENDSYRDVMQESLYQSLKNYIPVLELLTLKYQAVVANPPYMWQKNMNAGLKDYVRRHYPRSKSDLFAVFMESCLEMNVSSGYMGMINQHSWMFLSSYEKLRNRILDDHGIINMLHLGSRTFEELSGEVVQSTAFVLAKNRQVDFATYYRLVDENHIDKKKQAFLDNKEVYTHIPQSNFEKIPGSPIAYYLSNRVVDLFSNNKKLSDYADVKVGLQTGDNSRFRRDWHEVSFKKTTITNDIEKWVPYNSGGGFRKWYGNQQYVVNWQEDGKEIKELKPKSVIRNEKYYFYSSISWSKVSAGGLGLRYIPQGFIFDVAGCSIFPFKEENMSYILGLLNSNLKINLIEAIAPTLNYEVGQLSNTPIKLSKEHKEINGLVNECISLSRKDWNLREISWDFTKSPLLLHSSSIMHSYELFVDQVTKDFFQIHSNEEKLNNIFIELYELHGELSSKIALKDITILQEELNKNALQDLESVLRTQGKDAISLPLDEQEIIKQFISYTLGLLMGRYHLDKPGLQIAHPNPSQKELETYFFNDKEVIIDEDAIIPIMGTKSNFSDDAYYRVQELLDVIWGEKTRTENMNFIQECLNKDLEKFLVSDFWKYHCTMYNKKPIYWLFSSPKGAFQVLVYMHRMNAFTVEKIRANYLLEHLKYLRSEITLLETDETSLSAQESRHLERLRKDLKECEEYDLKLKDVADQQITFDLDDGVTENYKLFEGVVAKIK